RYETARATLLLALSLGTGVGAALGIVLFRSVLEFTHDLFFSRLLPIISVDVFGYNLGIILLPVLGGLIIGPIMWRLAPELVGHGIPETLEAFIRDGGRIRNRVSALKVLVSAITIGSGGSAGREGPGARIGASVGSTIGQMLRLRPDEVRLLLVAGLSAGVAATFNAPVGGLLFGMEIMYRRFRLPPVVILSLAIGSGISTLVARLFIDQFTAFAPVEVSFGATEIEFGSALGLLFGAFSFLWVKSLYGVEHLFNRMKVLNDLKPAIGGVAVGILGMFLVQYGIMGVGYDGIDLALKGEISIALVGLLAISKLVASSFTIGSGGSGGIFAPSLYMGAMAGLFLGSSAGHALPLDQNVILAIGMAAMFAGAARAPFTATVLVSEVAGNYSLVAPLLLPSIVSFLVANILLHRLSVYTLRPELKGMHIRPAVI
ncbi:MAG: chloride channel protein, partial [Dehalococcoidia bacterium]